MDPTRAKATPTLPDPQARRAPPPEAVWLTPAELHKLDRLALAGRTGLTVARELRNFLTVLQLGRDDLRSVAQADSRLREIVDCLDFAIEAAQGLTRDLLDVGRGPANALLPVDLAALVNELRHLLLTVLGRRATLVLELPPGLPLVLVDPQQLRQVLLNLVLNAREAFDQRGAVLLQACPVVDDRLGAAPAVRLTVRDDGQGMPPEVVERIFDPLFSTHLDPSHCGLGLTVVKDLVTGWGGLVRVQSAPGEGTTFELLLPVVPAPAQGD